MKITSLSNCLINDPIVVALGFFDSVHVAHRQLLCKCKSLAQQLNAKSTVFTFDNNPKEFYIKSHQKMIYDFDTRVDIFDSLGLDCVLYQTFDYEFANLEPNQFLNKLFAHNVVGVVCGFDYTFGKGALGNVNLLKDFCKSKNVKIEVCDQVFYQDQKVSTTLISKCLIDGDLKRANDLLGENYRYTSVVSHGYAVGRDLGFKTANVPIDPNLVALYDGVYLGYALYEGKKYRAMINVGARKTFDDNEKKIEAHIIDFNQNIYEKKLTLFFASYLRQQIKFSSLEELSNQLNKDLAMAKKLPL